MVSLQSPKTILSLGTGSALLILLYDRYRPSRNAQDLPNATVGHETSYAMSIMNPRHQRVHQHKLTLKIPAARLRRGITDSEVLALFTKGFFGGWVFTPERWLFRLTRLSLCNFEGTLFIRWNTSSLGMVSFVDKFADADRYHDDIGLNIASEYAESPAQEIWKPSDLSSKVVPPLGSLLFGNFLLADSNSATTSKSAPISASYHKVAEFVAGGSDIFELVSSHRFEVTRDSHSGEDPEGQLFTVAFSHVSCNSRSGRPYSTLFWWFHRFYARLLFADGIREVMEG